MRNRKLGYVIVGVVAVVALAGALVGGYEVGLSRRTAPAAPVQRDQVVGVEVRCEFGTAELHSERWGDFCNPAGMRWAGVDGSYAIVGATEWYNRRQVLTIRTSLGTSYTVAVQLISHVSLGDAWPP
jgi:hypothetical protein